MSPVNLQTVKAGFLDTFGSIGKLDDDGFNLRDSQGSGRGINVPSPGEHQINVLFRESRRGDGIFPSRSFGIVIGPGVAYLEEDGAAVLVTCFR